MRRATQLVLLQAVRNNRQTAEGDFKVNIKLLLTFPFSRVFCWYLPSASPHHFWEVQSFLWLLSTPAQLLDRALCAVSEAHHKTGLFLGCLFAGCFPCHHAQLVPRQRFSAFFPFAEQKLKPRICSLLCYKITTKLPIIWPRGLCKSQVYCKVVQIL